MLTIEEFLNTHKKAKFMLISVAKALENSLIKDGVKDEVIIYER